MEMAGSRKRVVRGRWLWTGERLISRGGVVVEGDRVEALLDAGEPDPPHASLVDLPDALLHPGLLDAHVHLDLSGLEGTIPRGLPFPQWLARIRAHRQAVGSAGLERAIERGIAQLVASGTAKVIDFAYGALSEAALLKSGLRAAVLRELIGLDSARLVETLREATVWLCSPSEASLVLRGLAPHSPYLATAELITTSASLCRSRPFSIHLAEFLGETEFLERGTGELADFLSDLGVGIGKFAPPGCGPIEALELWGALEGTLAVHANVLDRSDIERLRAHRAAVVFCPRSHAYFARSPHPLPELLASGVPVALGTDSSASCGPLSVAEEMREVRRQFPSVDARTVFALGTGALLPPSDRLPWSGVLAVGGAADFAAAAPSAAHRAETSDPLEAFLNEPAPCVLNVVAGQILHGAPAADC